MILVADSGSSKTEWRFITQGQVVAHARTAGYNPHHQSSNQILTSLQLELGPQLPANATVEQVYFYGAGCSSAKSVDIVEEAFRQYFPHSQLTVEHDLLAAARALCGSQPGIACILGTGSNSCLYNGNQIIGNVPALGYILGDEGSGTALGRRLVADYLRADMPEDLRRDFQQSYRPTVDDVLDRLYRQAFPKPYLAGFTRFLANHRPHHYCRQLLTQNFTDFLRINILKYEGHSHLPVHFVGSVAYHFQEELKSCLQELNLQAGQILESPMKGLVAYHS